MFFSIIKSCLNSVIKKFINKPKMDVKCMEKKILELIKKTNERDIIVFPDNSDTSKNSQEKRNRKPTSL